MDLFEVVEGHGGGNEIGVAVVVVVAEGGHLGKAPTPNKSFWLTIGAQKWMNDALFDLIQVLHSRKSENEQERMTSEEANVLSSCGANATRDFIIDFGGSSVVTWPGVAAFCGMWRFTRSVDSSIEHILSLEGSRMQRELANM
ncbi:Uncharacterized protein Fot_53562 [Forsythia ovata]|uniref:Uncharacterized protein n=1 Tax=Forsythia ovata TaxID=205694 RepID=A0ABD1PJ18_9LAMI